MLDGKMKAITFSYDDGTIQDIRLVRLFNRYGVKATFNLNANRMGERHNKLFQGREYCLDRLPADLVNDLYVGHEIAAHGLDHLRLQDIENDNDLVYQVEEDRRRLSALFQQEAVGFAFPYSGENADRAVALMAARTGVKYARTTFETGTFDWPTELYQLNPTAHHGSDDELFRLGRKFIDLTPDTPQLFYIWGHSYELDLFDGWDRLESFLQLISGRSDIFYGTNRQVLLGE